MVAFVTRSIDAFDPRSKIKEAISNIYIVGTIMNELRDDVQRFVLEESRISISCCQEDVRI